MKHESKITTKENDKLKTAFSGDGSQVPFIKSAFPSVGSKAKYDLILEQTMATFNKGLKKSGASPE